MPRRPASPPTSAAARSAWPRRAWLGLAGAAAVALAAPAAPARAQTADVIRDADTPALLAALRADIARQATQARAGATFGREVRADVDAMVARSHDDPLPHVRARTAHFVLPPDARYNAECSRATSAAFMAPRLVYAVGTPDTATEATLRGKDPNALTGKEIFGLMVRQSQGSAGRAFGATIRFYQARGFGVRGTVDSKAVLRWKGPAGDPLLVAVLLTNENANYGPGCASMGNTALLMLAVDDHRRESGASTAARQSLAQADAAFEAALARGGLTAARYGALLNAAWQAQRDAQEPDEAEQTGAMLRAPAPEIRAWGRARQQNRVWFERHRAEVGPVFEEYRRVVQPGGGG